jgi:methanogenic corrinoid protein MtbC1
VLAARFPIKLVSQRTGLSPHVLRVWERRYRAVVPARSDTNRRLYTEEEIVRLELLAALSKAGHGIGNISLLPTDELASLIESLPSPTNAGRETSSSPSAESLFDEAWTTVRNIDSNALRDVLQPAAVSLGVSGLTQELIVPLIDRIGASWESGEISVAEERAASAVIKEVLFTASRPFAQTASAPNFLVTTPSGQLHELGAVLVACNARRYGWEVTYLGPSLPAAEIARAAIRNQSLAVGLSIIYPADDAELPGELIQLRQALPDGLPILIGGRSAHAYAATVKEIDGTIITNLNGLTEMLANLREQRTS